MIVQCPVAVAAVTMPGQPAIVSNERTLTYADFDQTVHRVAGGLVSRGIGAGDRVGIRLGRTAEYPIVLWALVRLGAVAVPLSDRLPDVEIESLLLLTGCRLIVCDGPFSGDFEAADPRTLSAGGPSPGNREEDLPDLDLDAWVTMVFTSGSGALPKAVVHTLGNHWFSALGSQERIPVTQSTRWATIIPFYHVGGLSILFRCFINGGTVVVPDQTERTPTALAGYGATHVSIVPTQLIDWLSGVDLRALRELKTILVGGAATPDRIRSRAHSSKLPVRVTYGSTEMCSQVATTDLEDTDNVSGYVGRVLPYRDVKVDDGEILVRGATRFVGYWSDRGLVEPFDAEGWFRTGDLGTLDGDRLFVVGRLDSRFISGGENVYPEEIEEAILRTGLVSRAMVVPVDDERFGSRPVAFVRPSCSAEKLGEALTTTLPSYKIPDRVFALPDHLDGVKGDRKVLMEKARRLMNV